MIRRPGGIKAALSQIQHLAEMGAFLIVDDATGTTLITTGRPTGFPSLPCNPGKGK
jgi:hypothetical protein